MKRIQVIIALNEAKKRNVGKVIDVLERRKYTFLNKEEHSFAEGGLRKEVIELKSICDQEKFLLPLMKLFPKQIVERKIKEFIFEHVSLSFETEKDDINEDTIKKYICMSVYPDEKRRPLIAVSIEWTKIISKSRTVITVWLIFFAFFLNFKYNC